MNAAGKKLFSIQSTKVKVNESALLWGPDHTECNSAETVTAAM